MGLANLEGSLALVGTHLSTADGDMRQHAPQPGLGGDAVQLGRADQRVARGGALAAAVGTSIQVVAATDGYATQGAFDRRVVDLDGAVVESHDHSPTVAKSGRTNL